MTPTQPPRGPITFGSLFSGIGGLDLGLERAGMVCRWQCEIDPYATRVLEKHWPHVKRYSDVRTITDAEPVGLICGGVPCQPWSVAGKRRGQDDERDLWPEFWRVCLLVRPRFVLVEEVPGFAVPGGLGRALTDLARAGFDAEWFHLSAADVGAPHLRKRLFVVAYADSDRRERANLHVRRWRQDKASHVRVRSGANADVDRARLAQWKGECGNDGEERAPAFRSDWWESEPAVGRVVHGLPRRLAGRRRAAITALGNSVVPQVAEAIGRMIVRAAQ